MKCRIKKNKKGDISLLTTVLVCGILLSILTPLSQKIVIESKISKENLMSQQAIQAAKTGLDQFKYNLNNSSLSRFDINSSSIQTWPNSLIDSSVIEEDGVFWVKLDDSLGTQYRIEYIPRFTDPATDPKIIARARVKKNNFTIERTFEETLTRIPANCGARKHGENWNENTSPSSTKKCNIKYQCIDGLITEKEKVCKNLVCRNFYGYQMGQGANNGSADSVDGDCENRGNGSLQPQTPIGASDAYINSVSKRYCMSPSGYSGAQHGDCNNRGGRGKCGCWACQANGTECYYVQE